MSVGGESLFIELFTHFLSILVAPFLHFELKFIF